MTWTRSCIGALILCIIACGVMGGRQNFEDQLATNSFDTRLYEEVVHKSGISSITLNIPSDQSHNADLARRDNAAQKLRQAEHRADQIGRSLYNKYTSDPIPVTDRSAEADAVRSFRSREAAIDYHNGIVKLVQECRDLGIASKNLTDLRSRITAFYDRAKQVGGFGDWTEIDLSGEMANNLLSRLRLGSRPAISQATKLDKNGRRRFIAGAQMASQRNGGNIYEILKTFESGKRLFFQKGVY